MVRTCKLIQCQLPFPQLHRFHDEIDRVQLGAILHLFSAQQDERKLALGRKVQDDSRSIWILCLPFCQVADDKFARFSLIAPISHDGRICST